MRHLAVGLRGVAWSAHPGQRVGASSSTCERSLPHNKIDVVSWGSGSPRVLVYRLVIASSSLFTAFWIVRFPPTHISAQPHRQRAWHPHSLRLCVGAGGGMGVAVGHDSCGRSALDLLGAHCARQLSCAVSSDCAFGPDRCLLGFCSWGGASPCYLALRAQCLRAFWLPRLGNGFL